jgi:hypothetical protein
MSSTPDYHGNGSDKSDAAGVNGQGALLTFFLSLGASEDPFCPALRTV